ncbi:hypothetical protein LLEC1_00444 [Akanthomyces lecanii]|uniref:Methyltransferase domain-containing protein n=1 Tax=Cordyceps confragosa TaxID=2714763 RepID=A0A179II41_CORDF|nr:hypothetical protein LLEC1_00444 [Akanthomyces lecanii]
MAEASGTYIPGHKAAHIKHHAAAYLLPALDEMRREKRQVQLLDAGAGPGTISASFAERIPDGHVTVTDISDDVLSKARDHGRSLGLANMSFQTANILQLPFPDAHFDVTHVHQVLCHLPDPIPAIAEMLRVTRPGGIVAIHEGDLEMWSIWPESKVLKMWHDMVLKIHNTHGGSTQAGRRLLTWALAAGVKRQSIAVSSATYCYSAPDEKEMWRKIPGV